jgi:hypothetical protein
VVVVVGRDLGPAAAVVVVALQLSHDLFLAGITPSWLALVVSGGFQP